MARGGKIALERMKLVTEVYKATEGEPAVIRRAKSLAHVLENMTLFIDDGDLIVGHFSPGHELINLQPEMSLRHVTEGINDGYRDMMDEKDRKEYTKLAKYWENKTVVDRILSSLPKRLVTYAFPNSAGFHPVLHQASRYDCPNISKVLKLGLVGLIEQIRARLEKIEADDSLSADDYLEQKYNLEAMLMTAEAAIIFARRYATKARELASVEKDEKRKKELLRLAEVCNWVPANPARTLHEAIQCYFFCMLISKQIENTDAAGAGHRLDVILNPFYQRDKEKGIITRDEAQELLECLFIKFSDAVVLYAADSQMANGGGIIGNKAVTIGGVTSSGEDATNEFSFIILDAAESIRLPEPSVALRYHHSISPELISRAIDIVKTGIGYPAFYNDSAYIPWFQSHGYSLEKARNYGINACVGPIVEGDNYQTQHPIAGVMNLTKILELALFQGKDKDKYGGRQLGAETPDIRNATSVEEIMDAYLQQVRHVAHRVAEVDNIRNAILEEHLPTPFCSILIDGCIEKGKDSLTWTQDTSSRFLFTGTTNVANSLAAIKKYVFDEKLINMEELIEACKTNFEGKEELRQMLVNKAPKYGNDDDYVDELAREVHVRTNEAINESAKDRWGNPFNLDASIAGGYFSASISCGAVPDGKLDGEPTADASHSPSAGTDRYGPTAVLKSASKIPFTYPALLNQKFLPRFLEGESKKKFAQYLKTWADLGIGHIQFNVIDKATLLDAQAHPEKYTNLLVRVAGYSAYFVDLAKPLQDDIIRRTEQSI
jgi:formate C-acetyltransferase